MARNGLECDQGLENGCQIFESPTRGRGLVATRNFERGEVIFQDLPVLLGPRLNELCVGCHGDGLLIDCPNGCHLPVCSHLCADSPLHSQECSFLSKFLPKELDTSWKKEITCCIVVLRCLFLNAKDKAFMKCLQGHKGKIHGFEAKILKKYLGSNLSSDDEKWLHKCCEILDTNSFDVSNSKDNSLAYNANRISLRGIYYLACFMNHDCSPNTCLSFTSDGVMHVSAAKPILAGEEITTIYCTMLWNTPTRRNYINETKHFLCGCERCRNPTEFGANLSALACPIGTGFMLPIAPLEPHSSWSCNCCSQILSSKQISFLQTAQKIVMSRMDGSNPTLVNTFLTENEIPINSQVAIVAKLEAVQKIGHVKGFILEDLTEEVLTLKEGLCKDILKTMDSLQIGYCRSKGLVLLELHCVLCEKLKKLENNGHFQKMWTEVCNVLSEAEKIFNLKETAPKLLEQQQNIQHCMAVKMEKYSDS